MSKIRVGIIGVGNCAASLVQGVGYYSDPLRGSAGLMSEKLGPYLASDIEFVAAWDVDDSKVGYSLSSAIFNGQNSARLDLYQEQEGVEIVRLEKDVPSAAQTIVQVAPILDGLGSRYLERIEVREGAPGGTGEDAHGIREEVVDQIREAEVDVLLNYLPVGSEVASMWWAHTALDAGVAFVNCIPTQIARDADIARAFRVEGVPLIGDDIKSQLGATYLHRIIAQAFRDRGIKLDHTYQLNVGGNMDFYNMLNQDRLASKRQSKTSAVTDAYGPMNPQDVHIGPSDYVPWLNDTKVAFIRCEGTQFGGAKMNMEIRLSVEDSPNSAGVVIDAVRAAMMAKDSGEVDMMDYVNAWLFKAPRVPLNDDTALTRFQEWIENV